MKTLSLFGKLKFIYKSIKIQSQLRIAIDKQYVNEENQYDKIIDLLAGYESINYLWSKLLNFKSEKQKIALVALVYYIMICYYDNPYFWARDKSKMTEPEEAHYNRIWELFDYPIEEYKKSIFNNNFRNNKDAIDIFERYYEQLFNIGFFNLFFSKEHNHLAHKYLLIYFHSDKFDEINIMEESKKSEYLLEINHNKLEDQIEKIMLISNELGLDFESIQFKLFDYKIFCDNHLKTTFDNNKMFSFKKNFN